MYRLSGRRNGDGYLTGPGMKWETKTQTSQNSTLMLSGTIDTCRVSAPFILRTGRTNRLEIQEPARDGPDLHTVPQLDWRPDGRVTTLL